MKPDIPKKYHRLIVPFGLTEQQQDEFIAKEIEDRKIDTTVDGLIIYRII